MLNRIWFWLLVIGILYGPVRAVVRPLLPIDPPVVEATEAVEEQSAAAFIAELGKGVTNAAIDAAKAAASLCLSLIGPMVLWLGMMQVAKDAGLVDAIAWLLRPLMRWLFPEVPEGHPAHGAMLMNISANMLNLANAATPFGLKAMKELQTLNTEEETATNSMATFLAINTSSVTLVPFTIIALRAGSGSAEPAAPMFGILLATLCSTCVAIFAVRTLQRLPAYARTAPAVAETPPDEAAEQEASS